MANNQIKETIRLTLSRTRKGNQLKMTRLGKMNKGNTKTELKIDGITTMDELLEAVNTQLQFHLPGIMESFEDEIGTAEERAEAIRIKEMNYQRKYRQSTGGAS